MHDVEPRLAGAEAAEDRVEVRAVHVRDRPGIVTAATTWSIWSSKIPSVDGFVIISAATSGPSAARSASRSIPPRSFERIVTVW